MISVVLIGVRKYWQYDFFGTFCVERTVGTPAPSTQACPKMRSELFLVMTSAVAAPPMPRTTVSTLPFTADTRMTSSIAEMPAPAALGTITRSSTAKMLPSTTLICVAAAV